MRIAMTLVMVATLLGGAAKAQENKPPPPPETVPEFGTSTRGVCVDCDQPFDGATHDRILVELMTNPYVAELRKALYMQDSVHQFQSKAHFDNCDFDSAIGYIDSLLAEADSHVQAGVAAKAAGDRAATETAVRNAFFAIGQAMHSVQDFFAHSNYVELSTPAAKRVTDIAIVAPWRPEGKVLIQDLRGKGLVSGYVFWGFPQQCPSGTASHANLAKDTDSSSSGKVKIAHLQNLSQYRIAVFLAQEASQDLLRDAFKRWPLLKELNGANVAFDVLVDRRGL